MGALNKLRVVVAGGGVVGWTAALELARAGAAVTLAEPRPLGANASSVAAGMLAPVFEALFDTQVGLSLGLLREARDLWPDLASRIGVSISTAGAMAVGPAQDVDAWAQGARAMGGSHARLDEASTRKRSPEVREGLVGLYTDEDWRIEPVVALATLRDAAAETGVALAARGVARFSRSRVILSDGETLAADCLVVASGPSRSLIDTAPELVLLSPIKGHILRAESLPMSGPVVRFTGGYVCPGEPGLVIGATMEPGVSDDRVDAALVERLRASASDVLPFLVGAAVTAQTGVRAATPDGMPLVGPSASPDVWLAVGVRRNGWLLAPLVARMLVQGLKGDAPEVSASGFWPSRFKV